MAGVVKVPMRYLRIGLTPPHDFMWRIQMDRKTLGDVEKPKCTSSQKKQNVAQSHHLDKSNKYNNILTKYKSSHTDVESLSAGVP